MIDWNIDERTTAHLDPSDAQLKPFVQSIVEGTFSQDHIFCQNRNTVILSHFGGKQYVVKRFKRPTSPRTWCLNSSTCGMDNPDASWLLSHRLVCLRIYAPPFAPHPMAQLDSRTARCCCRRPCSLHCQPLL